MLNRHIKAKDQDYIWTAPLINGILAKSKVDPEHKLIIKFSNEKRDKSFIKKKLPSEHPAKLHLLVWDRLGLEEEQEGDCCIVTLDIKLICKKNPM